MIKLYKYYFDESYFNPTPNRIGTSKRSRTGKIFTDYSSDEFKTFEININGLDEIQHGHLLYIVSLIYSEENEYESLDFIDPYGNEYTVKIPLEDGYDYEPSEGKKELYNWQLELWEVI